jgi:RNA polymerase sigma-70 factor (ECF subfamily)
MISTSLSLLQRVKQAGADGAAWQRLHDLYHPLIRKWVTRTPGMSEDVDDVAQEVLLVVHREVARFERRREGSFRAWLKSITVNRMRAFWKARARQPRRASQKDATDLFLSQLEDPHSQLSDQWNREHDEHVRQQLLAIVRMDFKETSWNAFQRFALDGVPAAEVAKELGLSLNAVVLAKSRIMKRLREEARGLMD